MSILYDEAEKAINKVFSDTTVSQEATLIDLRGLRDEITIMIDTIEEEKE